MRYHTPFGLPGCPRCVYDLCNIFLSRFPLPFFINVNASNDILQAFLICNRLHANISHLMLGVRLHELYYIQTITVIDKAFRIRKLNQLPQVIFRQFLVKRNCYILGIHDGKIAHQPFITGLS